MEIGGLFFLGSFNDLLLNPESSATAASYVRERIAEIVDDPETAAMLSPDTTIGCKRLVVDTDYFRTFNRSNVSLVDVGDARRADYRDGGRRRWGAPPGR